MQPLKLTANNSKLSEIAMGTTLSSRSTVKVASVLTKGKKDLFVFKKQGWWRQGKMHSSLKVVEYEKKL